jgi:ketosteroid isomerase-like protein
VSGIPPDPGASDATPPAVAAAVARIVRLFDSFGPADVERLGEFYRADARFKDPFNEVQGVAAIQAVFRHMFVALDEPRFVVKDVIVQGEQCFLSWDFHFRMRRFDRSAQTVHGATHLHFDTEGRIAVHRDYWDAAEELYEKLPVVGRLMRWLRRRVNA